MASTFKFRGARAVTSRPAGVAGGELWAKNASALDSNDGTVIDATLLNEIAANLRTLTTALGTTPSADDDHTLRTAVEAYVASVLAAKAPLASPAFTGVPTAPTAALGTNTMQISTTAFVQAAIAALVDSSPGALDTLNELAAALGADANFATTVTNALAGKQPLDADLTAIAALTTTAYGRSLLEAADAAALRTLAGLGTAAVLAHGTAAGNLVRLDPTTAKLPAVDGSLLTNLPSGGVTDHGALTGLADDDHTQYHNDTRGDARYYTQGQVDTALSGKASTSHTHGTSGIDDDAVTYAKLQNVSATQRLLGRNTAGAGNAEEVSATQLLDWLGSTRGQLLMRGASAWSVLSPDASTSKYLKSGGSGADLSWGQPIVSATVATTGSGTAVDNITVDVSASGVLTITQNKTTPGGGG